MELRSLLADADRGLAAAGERPGVRAAVRPRRGAPGRARRPAAADPGGREPRAQRARARWRSRARARARDSCARPYRGARPRARACRRPSPSLAGDAWHAARRGHGLAIAARVARRHGGRLLTAPVSSGACVVLELPRADAAPRDPSAKALRRRRVRP